MKVQALTLALLLSGFTACGKKESTDLSDSGRADPPAKPDPKLVSDMGAVHKSLETKNYDAAIGTLVSLKSIPRNDADETVYQQQLRDTLNLLADQCSADPKAREAYTALGRLITGR